ncbi:hypothetical protein Q7P37_000067 [Cladosporium fusiforme]
MLSPLLSTAFKIYQLTREAGNNTKTKTVEMAKPGKCEHTFKVIKSDTTLILWNCNMCHSGPHWWIYECAKCKLKACKTCSAKAGR